MTPDPREAAIEAAALALRRIYIPSTDWSELTPTTRLVYLNEARAAIDAYEKAMWRPIEEASDGLTERAIVVDRDGLLGEAVQLKGFDDCRRFWWANTSRGDYGAEPIENLTHFRPLPQPPAPEGK